MFLIDFFKGIGRVLAKTFGIIKRVVPEEYLVHGIELAADAAVRFVDNAERRAWVIKQLMSKFPITESLARLITELAVQHIKHDIIDKLEDKAKDAVDDDK